jgi:pimeloyl-ACP methyl ester carboxylesterase
MARQEKAPHTKFVDVTPETERLKELDHFWIEIERISGEWHLWRFSFLDTDTTEVHLPETSKARFNEPLLLIHGLNSSHTIFNWFARELWRWGFRNVFAIDFPNLTDLESSSDDLSKTIEIIKEITKAHKISVIAHASGGVVTRYYTKFKNGAIHLRVFVMIGSPHDRTQYLNALRHKTNYTKEQLSEAADFLEDINSTIAEKELYDLTQVNIGGTLWSTSSKKESVIKFQSLSDAVNLSVGQIHLNIHKHKYVFGLLRPFLIPQVAIFKVRLLTFVNIKSPIFLMIHYNGQLTQLYPKKGVLAPTQQVVIPEIPIIVYTNYLRLDKEEATRVVIFAFIKEKMLHKKLGRVEMPIKIEKLPHIEYFSLLGDENQRIDFALYTHIP